MNRTPSASRVQVLRCLVDGMSLRATCRVTGVSMPTVLKFLVQIGDLCARLHDQLVMKVAAKRVQVDEAWSFVGAKQKNASDEQKAEGMGDAWTWIALDSDSKLVISWLVGGRDAEYASAFMDDVAKRLATGCRIQLTSDGHKPYLEAVEGAFGCDVDYAMLIKEYGSVGSQKSPDTRYSPSVCTGAEKRPITGSPDPKHINTSHVERYNLTMRMCMRRFTRLTNAFSKKIANHEHAVALHTFHYNFCRIHQSLRVTPAMEAGLVDRVWNLDELVARLVAEEDAAELALGPRRTRGKGA